MVEGEHHRIWDPGLGNQEVLVSKQLSHFLSYVSGSNDVLVSGTEKEWEELSRFNDNWSITELDTHANMLVVGSESYVLADTGGKAMVRPY